MTTPGHKQHPRLRRSSDEDEAGCVEVEVTQSGNLKIACFHHVPRSNIPVIPEHEASPNMFETITTHLMNSCVGCHCEPLKPALRRRTQYQPGPPLPSRTVSFGSMEIREFNVTLGDHPSAISGPPVALDWERAAGQRIVDLEEYERARRPRRDRKQLRLTYHQRRASLLGFSDEELMQAWLGAKEIRMQRKETLSQGMFAMFYEDFVESASRKYRRATSGLASSVGMA